MSRLHLFLRGITASYLTLAANIVYTLLSVPLALHYLSAEEFGCWNLVSQIVMYVSLIDLGMTPAMARVLVEHKDQRAGSAYGTLLQTGLLVGLTQGVIILVVGWTLGPLCAPLLEIPAHLRAPFVALVRCQCALTGLAFALRLPRPVLFAHQRTDWFNYIQVASLAVGFAGLWLGLASGAGIFSIAWAYVGIVVTTGAGGVVTCWRLGLLPSRGQWGRPSRQRFRELFGYGRDVFVVHVGSLLIMATQPVIVSRTLGLATVAAWTVGTRVFTLVSTLIWQLFDMSTPAFSEMLVRGETPRLRERFTDLVTISVTLAVVAGALLVACNTPFVTLWTHGRISWSPLPSALLAVWLVTSVVIHANSGLVVLTKQLAWLRQVFIAEGLLFIGVALLLGRVGGIPAIIGASIGSSLILSGAYSAWRINRLFGQRFGTLERGWLGPALRSALVLAPLGGLLVWGTHRWAPLPRLALMAPVLGLAGLAVLVCWGVPDRLRAEVLERVPPRAQGLLRRLWRTPAAPAAAPSAP